MTDNKFHVNCCLVQGDSGVFNVKSSVGNDVADLKNLIHPPIFIKDMQRVTLHIQHDDDTSAVAELLFGLVSKLYPTSKYCLHSSFFDSVFDLKDMWEQSLIS